MAKKYSDNINYASVTFFRHASRSFVLVIIEMAHCHRATGDNFEQHIFRSTTGVAQVKISRKSHVVCFHTGAG